MRRTYAFDTWREWITEAQALHRASQHPDLDAEDGGAVCRAAIVAISAAFEAYVEVLAETSGAALGERTYTDLEKAVLKFHNPRPEHIDNLLGACGWTCEVIRDMWHETDSRLGRRRGSVRDDIDAHQDDRHWVAHAQRLVEVSPGDVAERISDFSGVVASLDQFIGRAVEEETERPIWATQRDAEGDHASGTQAS